MIDKDAPHYADLMAVIGKKTLDRKFMDALIGMPGGTFTDQRWSDGIIPTKKFTDPRHVVKPGASGSEAIMPKPKKMLKPIAEFTKRDGRRAMLFCPGEAPQHVEAVYRITKVDGIVQWEGWMFADEILRDICPMGPVGATHFYELPTESTKLAPAYHNGGYASAAATGTSFSVTNTISPKDLYQDPLDDAFDNLIRGRPSARPRPRQLKPSEFKDDRFTAPQLIVMYEHEVHPRGCETRTIPYFEGPPILTSVAPIDANLPVKAAHKNAVCPVIDRGRDWADIVTPDGETKRVSI